MYLSDMVIVLSRPAEAGNVGAVCRAMKTMGLSRLRIVAPEFSLKDTQNEAVCRARAVHAFDIWEGVEFFDTLRDAVQDCAIVIGTTARRGRYRKQVTMTPSELAAFLKDHDRSNCSGKTALVFGNERTGLSEQEIEFCNLASHIPVSEAFPSLNISHAVQVYTYELFIAMGGSGAVKGQWVPLDQKAVEVLVKDITDNLKLLGFYKQAGRDEQERFFRDLFSRAAITEREGRYFASLITKAVRLTLKGNT